jgi:hypothetical protein
MTRDDGSTDLLDLHVSQFHESPRRRRRTAGVIGGALTLVLVVAGAGVAALHPHRSSAPGDDPSRAAAPKTPAVAAPASRADGERTSSEVHLIAEAALQRAGHPAGRLTVGTRKLVTGFAPPVVNFHECGGDGEQMEYLPVEIRDPLGGLAAAVTVQPGPTTPTDIGRLGFFFSSGNGDSIPCRPGAPWPTTDTFESISGRQVIAGYVVLDQAVTSAAPQGRPDVVDSLQLKISHLRQFDDYVPRPLDVGTPTVGQRCTGDEDAVCAPLG